MASKTLQDSRYIDAQHFSTWVRERQEQINLGNIGCVLGPVIFGCTTVESMKHFNSFYCFVMLY